ncbi:sensor histidine kinase [Maribacter sedimenticola]|nr:ATP-binding protein [Maribacter sedimenticola]
MFIFIQQGEKDITTETVLVNLKNRQYENALKISEKIKNDSVRSYCIKLSNLRIHKKPVDLGTNTSKNKDVLFLKKMIAGYNAQLLGGDSTIIAYQEFSKALAISESLGNIAYTKTALIGILDLLKEEIFIGSKQFELYLNYFDDIKADIEDEIILLLYQLVFYSKANQELKVDFNYFDYVLKLDSIFNQLSDTHILYPVYFHEKGIEAKIKGDYSLAEYYFIKSNSLCKSKLDFKSLKNSNIWQLADTKLLQGDLRASKKYLEQSRTTSKDLKDQFYDDRLAADIFATEAKHDSAYFYLNRSLVAEYNLGYKNNTLESSLLAVENQTDKLKLDQIISENKRKSTQNWLIVTTLALVFGAGFALLLQKNTTKKRLLAEQETQLKQERVDNLLKQQELVSIDAMIEGQEKERQRVANELHDDLGSLMATIKLHFNTVKSKFKDPALHQAETLLEEAYQKVRGMAHSKNSGVMSDQGLLPAIKKMAQVITETNALQVTVEDFGMGDRLENSLELSLFRTVQELVANAIKHAEATTLNIQLTQHKDTLNIIVEDNGKGFDRTNAVKGKNGMGLTNIEKRIEHLEGHFTIDSVLGKGTSILIDIPI